MTHLGGLLQLFFHVGTHRGISNAARHVGLHQTTLSEHMLTLERTLGGKLFERGEFSFTALGRLVFERVQPTFEDWDEFLAAARNSSAEPVRIAASELIQGRYMLDQVKRLQAGAAGLPLKFTADSQAGMQRALAAREIDIAIGAFDNAAPRGTQCLDVARIPLVLLVPDQSALRTAGDLWARGSFPGPLVVASSSEGLQRQFFRGLRQLGLKVPELFPVHALPAVTELILRGQEIGLSLDLPELTQHRGLRALALPTFGPAVVSMWWHSNARPAAKRVVSVLRDWNKPAETNGTPPPRDRPSRTPARARRDASPPAHP